MLKIAENSSGGVVFDADSEYRHQKIVRPISRELWLIFDFFRVVTVFESTSTPLKVELRLDFFHFLDQSEHKVFISFDQFVRIDAQRSNFSIWNYFSIKNFPKNFEKFKILAMQTEPMLNLNIFSERLSSKLQFDTKFMCVERH